MRVPGRRKVGIAKREVRHQDVDGKSDIPSQNLHKTKCKIAGYLLAEEIIVGQEYETGETNAKYRLFKFSIISQQGKALSGCANIISPRSRPVSKSSSVPLKSKLGVELRFERVLVLSPGESRSVASHGSSSSSAGDCPVLSQLASAAGDTASTKLSAS